MSSFESLLYKNCPSPKYWVQRGLYIQGQFLDFSFSDTFQTYWSEKNQLQVVAKQILTASLWEIGNYKADLGLCDTFFRSGEHLSCFSAELGALTCKTRFVLTTLLLRCRLHTGEEQIHEEWDLFSPQTAFSQPSLFSGRWHHHVGISLRLTHRLHKHSFRE